MQVIIPDLDDRVLFAPPPRIHSPAGSASSSSAHASGRPSLEDAGSNGNSGRPTPYANVPSWNDASMRTPSSNRPFRGAALGWHGRSGSATSDSSAGGAVASSSGAFHFPASSSNSNNNPSASGFNSSLNSGGSGFSFPVKKPSFASLRAAIKGQQANRDKEVYENWPILPRDPSKYDGTGSEAGDSTAGRRTALATPKPHANLASNYATFQPAPSSSYPSPPHAFSQLPKHERNDSQVSGHSRVPTSGGTNNPAIGFGSSGSSRYHHVQNASYYSDSHFSAGAASSSASSIIQPFGASINDLPPVPPLPLSADHFYENMPSTPGLGPLVETPFANARAMASATSFEQSDGCSPHKPSSTKLRQDAFLPAWRSFDDVEESSSVGYSRSRPKYDAPDVIFDSAQGSKTPMPTHIVSNKPSALAASLGADGLGHLPPGIGSADPKAPAEYALNILMSRFITVTALKVQAAIDASIDADPAKMSALASDAEELLESLYDSLAHVAKKNAAPVIQSLIRWRVLMVETPIDAAAVRRHLANTSHNGNAGTKEVALFLSRKKELITIYLLAKAMIAIAKEIGKVVPAEAQATEWEDQIFNMLLSCTREKDRERVFPRSISIMRHTCFEIVSKLIGEISRTRFMPISDRFVEILQESTKAAASKNVDELLVAAIDSMRHLRITVYPMELFEEGAEFVEILSRHFAACHGSRIKTAFSEAFTHLLLPVAQSASAEINHPTWIKAIDNIWPRAYAMTSKPRYWPVAYPLLVSLLSASPPDKFLTNWYPCLEAGVAKLKDRVHRSIVLNSALRLLWVYVFRCHESSSTTSKRLESFFRIWFPQNRRSINPPDSFLEPHIVMVHLVLHRHFDFGKELVLGFLSHSALGGSTLSLQPDVLSGQRMTIAIRAILLTLDGYVRGQSPSFPQGSDFARFEFETLPDGCGDELPESFSYPRAEIGEAQAQFNDLIGKIALLCDHQISDMTVFDARTSLFSHSPANMMTSANERAQLERDGYTWKLHANANLVTAFPRENQSYCDLLRACFESWPRCLSSNIAFSGILGVLFRAHISADPDLARASSETLGRIAKQRKGGSTAVVSGFMRCIFRIETTFWEIHPKQILLIPKIEQSIKLWIEFLNIWLAELRSYNSNPNSATGIKGFEMERTSAWAIIDEVEAYGLFLLCSASQPLRLLAIQVLRLVSVLDDNFLTSSRRAAIEAERSSGQDEEPTRLIHLLNKPCQEFLDDKDPQPSHHRISHLAKWKTTEQTATLYTIAEGDHEVEQSLWFRAMPRFLRMSLDRFPTTVAVFRSYITNRVLGMDRVIVSAADILNRAPASTISANTLSKSQISAAANAISSGTSVGSGRDAVTSSEQTLMAQHWRIYILALCTTTTSTEGSRGGLIGSHRRKSSEHETGERVIAARDLFQKLVPFLASDRENFQDAIVFALGNINEIHYSTLLDTMQSVSGTLTEDFKIRSVARSGLKRNRRLDRLRTALAHVLQLTSHHMACEGYLKDQKVLDVIHIWITETFHFLIDREIRQDWEFHKLRRFFCGVAEQFFNGLARLGTVEEYFPFEKRLRMFRVFRDWHSYSTTSEDGRAKLANLLSTAADQQRDDRAKEKAVKTLNYETQALSYHAGCAMAAFCQGSISMIGGAVPAPMVGSSLEAGSLLSWLSHLFSTSDDKNHEVAKRALRSLLIYNDRNETLINSTLERCISEPDRAIGKQSFFVVTADVIIEQESFSMPIHKIFCLALVKLGHPESSIRRKSFLVLSKIGYRCQKDAFRLEDFEVGVSSPLPAIYLRAQRDVSAHLANRFTELKTAMLSEYTQRIPHIDGSRRATTLGLLPEWLRGMELFPSALSTASGEGQALWYRTYLNLSNLLFLTVKYSDNHHFEVQDMWSSLAGDVGSPQNANAIIHFLIDQGLKFRNPDVVVHAKRIVSCFSYTSVGTHIFDQLCAMVEPAKMIQVPKDDALPPPDTEHIHLFRADLDLLLPGPDGNLIFSPGQLALFYVGEMSYERSEQLGRHLPTLLHAIFMHIDNRSPFVRRQALDLFEQMMRCIVSNGTASNENKDRPASKVEVETLFSCKDFASWTLDMAEHDIDDQYKMPKSLLSTVKTTLSIIEPFYPGFRQQWGSVALVWAASGPVRLMACRSFQSFRALCPKVTPSMMVTMLGRLADTVSDPSPEIQAFTLEVLYTLNLVVRTSESVHHDFLAQSWWATLACLSTINEMEFVESITLLDSLLSKLDIGSAEVISMLQQKCPEGWEGELGGLQALVLRGLRSSITSPPSFKVLAKLAKFQDSSLIDVDDKTRLGFLFVAALPWFLQVTDDSLTSSSGINSGARGEMKLKGPSMSAGQSCLPQTLSNLLAASPLSSTETQVVLGLALDLANIAERLEIRDLQRVATSIAKSRFRTKDDLVRQAVNCVRSNYLPDSGPEMAVLLLGETLNELEWMRRQAMQVLKIFFKAMDTRNHAPFNNLGSELLMPLLRLLSTPLSAQALEVLDEPIVVNGGPAANQILRMSLQWGNQFGRAKEQVSDASIFGPPGKSGWAVANPQDLTTRTRINVQALLKMCERTLDIAPTSNNVNFVVDDNDEIASGEDEAAFAMADEAPGVSNPSTEDLPGSSLGDIVNQLHDLSSFFGDEPGKISYGAIQRESKLERLGSFRSPKSVASGRDMTRTPSRVPSLRGLPYNRHVTHAPQPSNSSSAEGFFSGPHSENLPARSHAQIAKILSRSAFGSSSSPYKLGFGQQSPSVRHSRMRSDLENSFHSGITPTRSISNPTSSASHGDAVYSDLMKSSVEGLATGYNGPNESFSYEMTGQSPTGAYHEGNLVYGRDGGIMRQDSYALPTSTSMTASLLISNNSSSNHHAPLSLEESPKRSFDLREAQQILQDIGSGLGAPFEETPTRTNNGGRLGIGTQSPADSPLVTAPPNNRSRTKDEPAVPPKSWGHRSIFAKASKTLGMAAGWGNKEDSDELVEDSNNRWRHGRFDSVAKSAISNAKHAGDY